MRLWGLVTAAGLVAGAASVLGFFGSLNWTLDLCTHFRVQYFLGLSATSLLLLIPRYFKTAALFGLLAAVNLAVIVPLYLGRPPAPVLTGKPLRALLANVDTFQIDAIVAHIDKHDTIEGAPDLKAECARYAALLEEVSPAWLADLAPALRAYGYSKQAPREDNFGIALFSRFPISHSEVAYIGDAHVPSIVADIETRQGPCTVLATHPLPPGGRVLSRCRNRQLAELPRWVQRAAAPVILLGDLNVSPWSPHFRRLLRESGLRDSAQGRGVCPTWPTFDLLMLIPIDHCLYAPGIAIVNRQTGPNVGSDHFPVIVDFVIEAAGRQASEALDRSQ